MSKAETIADEMKTRLDGLSLSASFTTEVDFDGRDTAQTATQAHVRILPLGAQSWEVASRAGSIVKTVDCVLSIKQKATADADASGFMTLVEEILDDLAAQRFDVFAFQSLEFDEAFSLEEYHASGVFSVTVAMQFRGVM